MENFDFDIEQDEEIRTEMSSELGNLFYGIITLHTPWDTGNLAHSWKFRMNSPNKKKYHQSAEDAHYGDILEQGAPHGKHKNWISQGIIPNLKLTIVDYFSGELNIGGSFGGGFTKRRWLSSMAKVRGYGTAPVTIGHSRYNKDTRRTRLLRSRRIYER